MTERETVLLIQVAYREQQPFWQRETRPNMELEKELRELLMADYVKVIKNKRYEVKEIE